MKKIENMSGHPRVRGARSLFSDDESLGQVPIQFGTIQGADGTPVFYCVEGKGPPLVFCYGFACSTLHWTYQIDYFRKNYQCIWIDYRGHRRTPVPEKIELLSIDAIVEDLNDVLKFLEIPQAVFLGHSMGVSVVLEFAHRFPEKVSKLVLTNGTAKKPLETLLGGKIAAPAFQFLLNIEKNIPELIEEVWKVKGKSEVFFLVFAALGFNRHLSHPGDIKTYADQITNFPPHVMTALMADYEKFDATPWLHLIKQPTLIFSGEKDYITPPATQDLIHQLMPHSKLVSVRHGSHCCTIDLPELINLEIEKFL